MKCSKRGMYGDDGTDGVETGAVVGSWVSILSCLRFSPAMGWLMLLLHRFGGFKMIVLFVLESEGLILSEM